MSDQATALRQLIQQTRTKVAIPRKDKPKARTIAVCSGKGGVGKSVLALNLGVALAQQGCRVCLLDANLGLSNLDLLCGLNGYWNLAHVVTGARTLEQILLQGPEGLDLVPGASGIVDLADSPPSAHQHILEQMEQLESGHDFLIVDTGTGIHRPVRAFAESADLVLVVTTPEPTAIADAYATVKSLATQSLTSQRVLPVQVLVNQVKSSQQARRIYERMEQTSRIFARREVGYAGFVPADPSVPDSVIRRQPFVVAFPDRPASLAVKKIAVQLRGLRVDEERPETFFSRLWNHFTNRAA